MTIILTIAFAISIKGFKTKDPLPTLEPITIISSKEFATFSIDIDVGLLIKNFPHFDMNENKFVVESLIPKVGYFTTTDYIYDILLTYAFIVFALQVIITNKFDEGVCLIPAGEKALTIKQTKPLSKVIKKLNLAKNIVFVAVTTISTMLISLCVLI